MNKILKNLVLIFFLYFLITRPAYSVNITGANTINSDSTTVQTYNADDTSLTITNSSTLSRTGQAPVNINEKENGTLTIHSGSSLTATSHNTVQGKDQTGLTITNSGTISSGGSKAINLLNAQDSNITNNAGGIIKSNTNTITLTENSGTANNVTINNSGQIFAEEVSSGTTNNNAVKSESDTNNMTLINNAGGHIYNNNSSATALQQATVFIAAESSATLTNSGTIENKAGPENYAIRIAGSGVTVTLKDSGKVIGKINVADSGHTIKFQHGLGRAYFYDIDGSGTYTLQDLDGNQVVKGSAGSVGQGGSETIDEMLSYKSINLRNFLNRYENSNLFNHEGGWGELYSSLLNRSEDSNSLAMEYNLINLGANLIYPLENSNFIMMFEGGVQDFAKDYRITYQDISGGIHILENDKFFNLDTFITGGVTLKDGKRKVLTNTVSSGTVDSNSNFQTYDIQIGAKKKNFKIIPDIGFTSSMSITPTYDESKFYSWRNRLVGNLSIYLSDDYLIRDDKEEKLNLNWALDLRSAIGDDEQIYSINGTTATYKQDNDLKREISLSASMNYEKYIFENSKIGVAYYGLLSSQNTLSLGGNAFYKMNF